MRGGVLVALSQGTATTDDGSGLLFSAFTAVFLGATTIRPGQFNPMGTLIGAIFLAVISAGLISVGVSAKLQPVVTGVALIGSVGASTAMRRASVRRAERAQLRALQEQGAVLS